MTEIMFATLSYILLYKYVALFIIAYFAAVLIPLPSNTTLLAAAAFAGQGYLSIYVVITVALIANVLGDITGFTVSERYGKAFLMRNGLAKVMTSKKYLGLEKFIIKNAGITIFVTRFFGGVGPLINILTGLSKEVSLKKFLAYGIPGELVYVLFFSLSGYFLGSAWEDSMNSIELYTTGIAVVLIAFIAYKLYTSKH